MYGINIIDRRRRSEALWFVENEVECRKFIEDGKFKGTSLTALQKAMRDADKSEQTTEGETSNVGQSDAEQPKADAAKPRISHKVMVNTIIAQAELNELDLEDIITDLMAVLEKRQAA
jgi:hypothetical protein